MKIRMQLQGELEKAGTLKRHKTIFHGFYNVVKAEGIKGPFKGMTGCFCRDGSYSTLRLGSYEPYKKMLGAKKGETTPVYIQVCAGMLSGLTGSAFTNPTDLVKVRMQAWEKEPVPNLRWHVRDIYSNWGLKGFYTGVKPTIIRAIILNGSQLSTYDHSKHYMLNKGMFEEGKALQFTASFMAGLAVAFFTSPIDVIKTRVMNVDPKNPAYTGMTDAYFKIMRTEGIRGFYKGINAQWMRIGPLTMLQFMFWEQLRKYFGMSAI
jgi:hypothetical protein